MPLPGSNRNKKFLQEIVEPEVNMPVIQGVPYTQSEPEAIVNEKPKKKRRKKTL